MKGVGRKDVTYKYAKKNKTGVESEVMEVVKFNSDIQDVG